jgi:hypothetical protein
MNKDQLTYELLHHPVSFTDQMLEELMDMGFNFVDIRKCIERIYDLSETQLTETSNANTGLIGKLNSRSTKRRTKRFNRKIKKLRQGGNYKIIYAEGDSWFQFPVFVKDIIDWLNSREGYIIYSDAYGGDWIANIIYESQYIPALSVLRPGYFLISGGGNDLAGGNRLAIMVQKNYNQPKYLSASSIQDPSLTKNQKDMIMMAQPHITKEFYAFLWAVKAQYKLLFSELYHSCSTQKDIISITQGYDYAIPDDKMNCSVRYPFQPLVNKFLDNGCWLKRPLMIRGIFDEELQRALVMTFIYEFNQILISMATDEQFPNVYHVDCRDLATCRKNWYDEMHYKSHIFRKVAKAYEFIIENHATCSKVIRVKDIL